MFFPGKTRTGFSKRAYLSRIDVIYWESSMGRQVECHVCRKEIVAGSLASHMTSQHGIYHVHLVAEEEEEEETEEVCTPVPTKPMI